MLPLRRARTAPRLSYIVCSDRRTGGTLLCEALRRTSIAGRPGEYFNPLLDTPAFRKDHLGITADAEYLPRVVELSTTPNGVFGMKIHFGQLPLLLERIGAEGRAAGASPAAAFAARFPGLRYVWLRRRDEVRQAISLYRAQKTNIWWEFPDEEPPLYAYQPPERETAEDVFDFEAISRCLADVQSTAGRWEQFFSENDIVPLRLTYEELDAAYEETVARVLRFLELTVPEHIPPKNMARQADGRTDAWVEEFRQRSRGLRDAPG
ncbi:MAG TPA: Stf0 family sulfotransferase [Candidatus Paceibacterota bacterium]|nr:Stf0 family sulfotransferase [Candidatus Paceibacterota bacterium]